MVRTAPPRSGGGGGGDNSHGSSSKRRKQPGLEWSLRSLHKIDTSAQHFLQNYYNEDDDSDADSDSSGHSRADQTAYEIFKGKPNPIYNTHPANKNAGSSNFQGPHYHSHNKSGAANNSTSNSIWASLSAPLRTGIVDGKKVVFELHSTGVTKSRPSIPRSERLRQEHEIVHSNASNWEIRLRFVLMQWTVSMLSIIYLVSFLVMNVLFAVLFWVSPDKCCGDPSYKFSHVFAFTIQTSTTIGYVLHMPVGYVQNAFLVFLSYLIMLMNTLFAGLLFTKFVTPVINIQCSEVMTLRNVNGVPCLSVRLGNADGPLNPLTDINVRLTYSYQIPYTDHRGQPKLFEQTEDLRLLSNRRYGLDKVWTLRHVLDESSPLFGLNFQEHPGNKIVEFTLSVDAVQNLTKSSVNLQTAYSLEDIMIGHGFKNQVTVDPDTKVMVSDYSKMSDTEPYPVWYPALTGSYGKNHLAF